MASKKNFYAVLKGRKPGIYTKWYGEYGAHVQVDQFPGAIYKGFATKKEAQEFLCGKNTKNMASDCDVPEKPKKNNRVFQKPENGRIVIYTDGGALDNPGPGGYGIIIDDGKKKKEISGGYRWTTNNRMELLACIKALESLKKPSDVVLYSDSKYVVDGVTKGWAEKWRKNGWMKNKTDRALNADLWERLLDLLKRHRVEFKWVRGHSGNPGNERCDVLVRMESAKSGLPPDQWYETQNR